VSGRTTDQHDQAGRVGAANLPAKLRPPRVRADALTRTALVERLAGATDVPCVVLSSGAGYGKTTVVRQWVEQDPRPVAWITLDVGDNDPVALLRYLLIALDQVEPLLQDDWGGFERSDAPALRRLLAAAVADDRRPAVVVLDDVHVVGATEAWQVIRELVDLAPEGWQVVVSVREVPRIDLPRRRLQGSVLELGTEDLAFTPDEAMAVMAGSGAVLDGATAAQVVAQSEGWPAGVYLAVLALHDHDDPAGLVGGLRGDHRLLAQYFHGELLSRMPDHLRRFLVHTSVLERVCGPLCDAVTGSTGSGAVLEELATSRNLFVVPLDNERTWYRYHHLFGELLLSELRLTEPQVEADLRRRAVEWCRTHGEPGTAFDQAVAAADLDLAAGVVADELFDLVTTDRIATLERWLGAFPADEIRRRAPLAVANGWVCLLGGDDEGVRRMLEVADGMEPPRSGSGHGGISVALSMLRATASLGGVKEMHVHAGAVRDAGPDGSPWYGWATLLSAVCSWFMGDPDPEVGMQEAWAACAGNPAVQAVATSHLALMHLRAGRVEDGCRLSDESVGTLRALGLEELPLVAVPFAVHAEAEAHRRRPEASRRSAERSHRLGDRMAPAVPRAQIHLRLVTGWAAVLRGDLAEARFRLGEVTPLLPEEPDAAVLRQWYDDLSERLAGGSHDAARVGITAGEFRILQELPTHRSLEEIGERLYVSRNTVKSHTVSIYRKLGVSSRSAAVERARELGLVD
jgi:LuxR family transcriptional regulator, maltose regulon positive regulatory protein